MACTMSTIVIDAHTLLWMPDIEEAIWSARRSTTNHMWKFVTSAFFKDRRSSVERIERQRAIFAMASAVNIQNEADFNAAVKWHDSVRPDPLWLADDNGDVIMERPDADMVTPAHNDDENAMDVDDRDISIMVQDMSNLALDRDVQQVGGRN